MLWTQQLSLHPDPVLSDLSKHFRERQAHRGLSRDVLSFIVQWSRPVHGAGAVFLTLRIRDLPPDLRGSRVEQRARDWVITQSREGAFITCYRRSHATSWLRKQKAGRRDVRRLAA